MPVYTYREILPDGSEGDSFEAEQGVSDKTLERHPVTGNPVRRVFSAPNLVTKYSEREIRRKTTDKAYLESKGFTRYEKDKVSGTYHKTAGSDPKVPDVIDPRAQ